jgi:RNA exonuclease 1
VVSCAATIKKRPKPDNPEHASVGTEAMLASRAKIVETEEPKEPVFLSAAVLEPFLLKPAEMRELGYPEEPDFVGGLEPSAANQEKQCDRCRQYALIVADMHSTACQFHWGRLTRTVTNGI